jgi:predicted metalloprotease with PDZ domain
MKNFKFLLPYFLLFCFMNTNAVAAATPLNISYTVTFPEAQAHYIDVQMDITGLTRQFIDLKMPVWTPGSYLVREFAKNVEGFSAFENGHTINFQKVNKNTWRVNNGAERSVTIKYRVYAFEISVRTSFVDASHGFVSTSGVFLYPDGLIHNPSTIHIKPYTGWTTVSTSLEQVNGDQFTLHSPDYDILFDSPIEIGTQDVFGFDAVGVKYKVAMVGGGNYDKERLKKDMANIVEHETAIFKENPNKHYTFIVHNYAKGGGGLEHLSSTVLGASREGYTNEGNYQNFLSLVAHEHFHLWNVKRIRPIVLGPFDYDNENYTTDLWIAEGFTAYYDNLIIRRTNLYTPENYLGVLAADINIVENQPGAAIQPLSQASFDAWIKAYRPNENSLNSTISYYNKGSVVAMMLDLEIIKDTHGAKSLDDVMKYMYDEYYKNKKRGYTDNEFKAALEKYAGKNRDDFYSKYVNGLAALDYNKYLGYAGYSLVNELENNTVPALGVITAVVNGKLIVTNVLRNSAAWKDGINVNDEITQIDGQPVTDLAKTLSTKNIGDKINVGIARDSLFKTIPTTLLKNEQVKYRIKDNTTLNAEQLTVRKKWLNL